MASSPHMPDRQTLRKQVCLVLLLFSAFHFTLAGGTRPAIGTTEDAVLENLGKPSGKMVAGPVKTLIYPDFWVEIQDGKVVGITDASKPVAAPPVPSAPPKPESRKPVRTPPSNLKPAEKQDLPSLMETIRTGTGTAQAKAVDACDGEWAAPAIPLIIGLLADTTPFTIHTIAQGGLQDLGGTSMGAIAAKALGKIGMQAWTPCMGVLQSGTPFARAHAAHALQILHAQSNRADSSFPQLLILTFQSPVMQGNSTAIEARRNMALTLGAMEFPGVLEALHRALPNPDRNFTVTVIGLLGRRRDPASIPLLADMFLKHADESYRENAGQALLEYSSAAAARAVTAGATHANAKVRARVAQILGLSQDVEFAPLLLQLLKDTSEDVRRNAVQGLGHIKHPSVLLPLIASLQNDTDVHVIQNTGNILSGMLEKQRDPAVIQALVAGLKHGDPKRRARFADLAGRTGAPDIFTPLAGLARNDPDEEVRRVAVGFLGNFENPERKDVLRACLLKEPSIKVWQQALQSVKYGSLRDEQDTLLLDIVRNGKPEYRKEAVYALHDLHKINRNPEILTVLIRYLSDPDKATRERAEGILFQEARIPQYSKEGRAIGNQPAPWKAWWKSQGIDCP